MNLESTIAVGARPGTLVIPENSPPPEISVVVFSADAVEEREIADPKEFFDLPDSDRPTWIDIRGLGDEATLWTLAEIFSIHPLALEDIVNVPGRPKVEVYDEFLLLIALGASFADDVLEFEQIGFVLGPHRLITFRAHPGDVFEPVLNRLRKGRGRIRREDCDYLAYALLDCLVDTYFPILETLTDDLDELEGSILDDPRPQRLEELNRLRRRLLRLRRSMKPQREAVSMLLREDDDFISEPVRVYLRDVQDHCLQLNETIDAARETAVNLVNLYLSVLGHRTNDVMRVLTIVTTIFVPLTFLAGIYGMNFEFMPELSRRWGYPVLLVVMAATAITLLLVFRRIGWLGSRSDDGSQESVPESDERNT